MRLQRNRCHVHSVVYNKRSESDDYCVKCGRACCEEHFAANGICYLCNGFTNEEIEMLDKENQRFDD